MEGQKEEAGQEKEEKQGLKRTCEDQDDSPTKKLVDHQSVRSDENVW